MIERLREIIDSSIDNGIEKELVREYYSICAEIKKDLFEPGKQYGSWWVYNSYYPFHLPDTIKLLKFAKARYTEQPTLLDVGCGIGNICYIAEKLGFKTQGVELSHTLIEKAKELSPNTEFIEEDIFKYTRYDEADVIWIFNPCGGYELEHILPQLSTGKLVLSLNTTLPERFSNYEVHFASSPSKNFGWRYLTVN